MKRYILALLVVLGALSSVTSCSLDKEDHDNIIVGSWEKIGGSSETDKSVIESVIDVEITPLSITVHYKSPSELNKIYGPQQYTEFEFGPRDTDKSKNRSIICAEKLMNISELFYYSCTNEGLTLISEDKKTSITFKKK